MLKDAEIVEYADLIHDAAGHLLAVINNILDISKIQSGKLHRSMRARCTSARSCSALGLLPPDGARAPASTLRGATSTADLPAIRGDGVKLRQVFTNLISQRAQVHAQRRLRDDRGARLQTTTASIVRVRDTGVGMSEEEIAVALTPFGQVDASRARWREGTGLGLPIAKALVRAARRRARDPQRRRRWAPRWR